MAEHGNFIPKLICRGGGIFGLMAGAGITFTNRHPAESIAEDIFHNYEQYWLSPLLGVIFWVALAGFTRMGTHPPHEHE